MNPTKKSSKSTKEKAGLSASKVDTFPIVGIGASAGGLAAFEAFFSGMPVNSDPGMAFVLVQHLAPDHKSILAELVRRYTRMQVFEVEDGMRVEVNCAYIIPPNRDMAFLNGNLQLLDPAQPHGRRLPIDYFFSTLAEDLHDQAIGIILSGTGSDGTLGARAIKAQGGMVMAQTPESTEFDGMPRSAIATGVVDYELKPADMAAQLIAYVTHASQKPLKIDKVVPVDAFNSLQKIFVLLRTQTGHDFSEYKPSTIHRRIERRLAIQQITTIESYVKYLQKNPIEVEALFHDLLIGVTNFFRDIDAFKALEDQVIPRLFVGRPAGKFIRVWSTGCSTGEEAYSVAILLLEQMEKLKGKFVIQIFATDIDSRAISTARAGVYPVSVAADISPERLSRFFTLESDGSAYRIHKSVRDLVIFSEQDMIKDPPFSRLDLIICRNVLIYLEAGLQRKLIPLFHYALNTPGYLFLGTSEGVGDSTDLFEAVDRKSKLYMSKPSEHRRLPDSRNRFLLRLEHASVVDRVEEKQKPKTKLSVRELTEQALLKQLAQAGALVNAAGDILYLHGRTGLYLEPPPGESGTNNIIKMAREGLRPALSMALRDAILKNATMSNVGLHVKTNGHYSLVNLTVCPLSVVLPAAPGAALYLVILEESQLVVDNGNSKAKTKTGSASLATAARIAALEQELRAKDEFLQNTQEELEGSNEELKSSNEEMQSVNEELQSSNEELETSKEELQSVNEELATVNNELQTKVTDLSHLNNDMNNLLAGTGIATVFVDHRLFILRFTPTVSQIMNLIASDVGRPINHIVSNLVGYSDLVPDVQSVLNTLTPVEKHVQALDGKWYAMGIRPYRTLENVIEGAVITFTDISEIKLAEETLEKANNLMRLATVVRDSNDAIILQDLTGRILAWNPGAVRLYGFSENEGLKLNSRDRIPEDIQQEAREQLIQASKSSLLSPLLTKRLHKNGTLINVSVVASALTDESGKTYAISTTERQTDNAAG